MTSRIALTLACTVLLSILPRSTSAADPPALTVCITAPGAASDLVDANTKRADRVRAALVKDKDAKTLLTVVEDCSQALVVVIVGERDSRTKESDVWNPYGNKATGYSKRQVTNYQILRGELTVPSKDYTTELKAERLEDNMFSISTVETLLAKEIRKWAKENGAKLTAGS